MGDVTPTIQGTDVRDRFHGQGYAVLPSLLDAETVAVLLDAGERVRAAYLEGIDHDADHVRHLNDPRWYGDDAAPWVAVMEAMADPRLLDPLAEVLGEPAMFRTTTFWFNPRVARLGNWHRDQQFLQPTEVDVRRYFEARGALPVNERRVTALQLQVALVPSDDIEYVPGSSVRYDTETELAVRRGPDPCADIPGAMRVHLEPGDGVVFDPDGLHRGRYLTDPPRRTFMLTVTAASVPLADEFTQQPWMRAHPWFELLSPRARRVVAEFCAAYGPHMGT
jgi:ectoine hydroxylase-related dioxygenase (phytanoyl-CoA dioxygenase family)